MQDPVSGTGTYSGTAAVTQGEARITVPSLFSCERGRARVASMGEITDLEGTVWTMPADNVYRSGTKAVNLYDECSGNTPSDLSEVNTDDVPVVEIDANGEVITGYIFADNYFELYVNGTLVGVDSVPFTPFNSSIVKFRASRPYTLAVRLIDWEENLGLGSEKGRGKDFQPGDGGFIASFSDGTVTGAHWQAQTYYMSPIYDPSCVKENGQVRSSTACDTSGRNSSDGIFALHWPVPGNWADEKFDSSLWPEATVYSEEEIGVYNKKGYMNFQKQFTGSGAAFIWSSGLILDNEVLLRYRAE